jgi:hypothetical protein
MKNIEDLLFPHNGKLVINEKEQTVSASVVDAELDPIECSFNNDECITLHTEELRYLTLSVENLEQMLDLIYESTQYYNKIYNNK